MLWNEATHYFDSLDKENYSWTVLALITPLAKLGRIEEAADFFYKLMLTEWGDKSQYLLVSYSSPWLRTLNVAVGCFLFTSIKEEKQQPARDEMKDWHLLIQLFRQSNFDWI